MSGLQVWKNPELSALALSACYTSFKLVLILQNSRHIIHAGSVSIPKLNLLLSPILHHHGFLFIGKTFPPPISLKPLWILRQFLGCSLCIVIIISIFLISNPIHPQPLPFQLPLPPPNTLSAFHRPAEQKFPWLAISWEIVPIGPPVLLIGVLRHQIGKL